MKNIVEIVDVKNKCSFYSKEENLVRKGIMNFIIDNNKAFNIKNDLKALDYLNLENINEKIESLIENNGLVSNDNDEVIFAYPVSALPTNHMVTMEDGRTFSAMCAIDAMGTAFTFSQNVRVNSKCSSTGEDVCVVIENGRVKDYSPKTLHALHVDLNKFKNWGASCWNIMNFFGTEKDFDTWVDNMNIDKDVIFKLNLLDAVEVSKELFEFRV